MNTTNLKILDVNRKDRHQVAAGRKQLDQIRKSAKLQQSLRQHIAYGVPVNCIGPKFGITTEQCWTILRELEII
ncbi:hypothetical protein CRP01_11175 [Flavilitoribacter nigricans DSM 23189 = NBRC 102662]|uniref:Uncharacterized protein n=1 Tax=Flavilitoribacter nigricans (strain ATCC 23147 / DSM 23189 / NBRC 102662 / NCIMB 1420 / SS-2) TaxID=1122177 RepID=A0A2D0NEK2_FLAN2|nr:hypothetical protein CRP01_11175 [Flavilitoribacter nigricans DSM 23189 = NBRC 102662]